MTSEVFISHSSQDQPQVAVLCQRLDECGVSVWMAPLHIRVGQAYAEQIVDAVECSKVVILMASRVALASDPVFREVMLAYENRKTIMPVFLELAEIPKRLRFALAGLQHLQWPGADQNSSFFEILRSLKEHGVSVRVTPPSLSDRNPSAAARAKAEALFARAREEYLGNRVAEGARMLREARTLDPLNAGYWNDEGVMLADLGRLDESVGCLGRCLELSPESVDAWNNLGRTLRKLNRHEEAIECYEKAIDLSPGEWEPWSNKAGCLADLGRAREALSAYDAALRIIAMKAHPQTGGPQDTIRSAEDIRHARARVLASLNP